MISEIHPHNRSNANGQAVAAADADETPAARSTLRIAVVTPIPTPYRDPFWSEVAGIPGVKLSVFYCSKGMADHPWTEQWSREFEAEVLPGSNLFRRRGADASLYWNPSVAQRLAAGRFDAILIGGYNHPTMWAAMFFAVRNKVPYFLMCESHERFLRPRWKRRLKRPLLRWVVKHAAGFLPTGTLATEYLCSFGARPEQMLVLPNVPDVERLRAQVAQLRNEQDFPGPPEFAGRRIVLFVGRLIPKKRAELVIRAFQEAACPDTVLAIVGDGELRRPLEQLVNELGIRAKVHFAGFVQPHEVLRWYACAGLFVLPSSETFGAAVVEALAAGVPVVVSDEVGACVDVVNNESVGTIVPARDQVALVNALRQRMDSPTSHEIVDHAWEVIRYRLTYPVLAQHLVDGIARLTDKARFAEDHLSNQR